MSQPRYTIIADPHSNRWKHYHKDLFEFWHPKTTGHQIPIGERVATNIDLQLIDWRDVVRCQGRIESYFQDVITPRIFRIESPSRNAQIAREITEFGQSLDGHQAVGKYLKLFSKHRGAGTLSNGEDLALKGTLGSPKFWYRGFCELLDRINASLPSCGIRGFGPVAGIKEAFDKNQTIAKLQANGIPTPETLPQKQVKRIKSIEDLMAQFDARNWRSAYIKLAHGASATGIAYWERETNSVTSTLIQIDGCFHNTRSLQSVRPTDAASSIQEILRQGATIQLGIRPAQLHGLNFDVRVVVLRGEPIATVFRGSDRPMTNLILGGHRLDAVECRRIIPQRKWLDGLDHCVEAAEQNGLPIVGVDLIFEAHTFHPYILEINAFGDFLPEWKNESAKTVHQLEIESTAQQCGL